MREARSRWVGRHGGRKLGLAFRLPRNQDYRELCTQVLEHEGYAVETATFYYMNHEDYPGYNVVDCELEDGSIVTMFETDIESA